MAYAKIIEHACGAGACDKKATHEVFNIRSASYGCFCASHAKQRLKELLREEAAEIQKLAGRRLNCF